MWHKPDAALTDYGITLEAELVEPKARSRWLQGVAAVDAVMKGHRSGTFTLTQQIHPPVLLKVSRCLRSPPVLKIVRMAVNPLAQRTQPFLAQSVLPGLAQPQADAVSLVIRCLYLRLHPHIDVVVPCQECFHYLSEPAPDECFMGPQHQFTRNGLM